MATSAGLILLVEDCESDSFLIEHAFRHIGVNNPILTLNNGNEAISYLKGDGIYSDRRKYPYPRFIITDLKMPDGDGFEVLQFLKNNPMQTVIPTVVFTSSSDEDDIKRAYSLGASAYHTKPIKGCELEQTLRRFYDYWVNCEVPATDSSGRRIETKSQGKLGARFDISHHKPQSRQGNAC